MKKDYIGFGYNPAESGNHFYIEMDDNKQGDVLVYERFKWDDSETQTIHGKDILKLKISKYKWEKLQKEMAGEFNKRLKEEKKPIGKFISGTPVEKQMGKEMMVLLWGIENSDPSVIPTAIRNWLGLMPEERWWLYTMTNASTGRINDKNGWRMALRYALCDNPVPENNQMTIEQMLGGMTE